MDYFNKQGWGYADSAFAYNDRTAKISFKGNRYLYSGQVLPEFATWVDKSIYGVDYD